MPDNERNNDGQGEPLMEPEEVARLLKVSLRSIYRYVADSSIPHIRVGGNLRFRRADIDQWLESRHQPATTPTGEAA